jgi:hypothetical protein
MPSLDHTARVLEIHFHFFASKAAESRIATETFHVESRGLFRGVSTQRPRAPFPAHRDFECGWRIGDRDAETSHLPGCGKTKLMVLVVVLVVVVVEEMDVVSGYQEPGNFPCTTQLSA